MINKMKILLSPFAFIYRLITASRNFLFDKRIFKEQKIKRKIISIGNLTVGGSGKTPTVINVVNLLKSNNIRVGILSRGYGRKTKGYLLVSDGLGKIKPVEECGDEVFLLADECRVPSAVAERRVEGAKRLINDVSDIEVIVLDDAFQHRWIYRDLNILIFDQRFLLNNANFEHGLLPAGLMRESFQGIRRADLIIINRKFSDKAELPDKIQNAFSGKKVFNAHYEATGIYDLKTHQYFSMREFEGQKSLVVCGIARPYSFLNILEQNSIDIKNKILFNDHKDYNNKEIQLIRKKFYETNSFSVLTTQKDAVKLTHYSKELDDIDIYFLKIELKIEHQQKFDDEILNLFNKPNGKQ